MDLRVNSEVNSEVNKIISIGWKVSAKQNDVTFCGDNPNSNQKRQR